MVWIGGGGSADPAGGAHGAAGEAALRHAGGPRRVRHAQRRGPAEGGGWRLMFDSVRVLLFKSCSGGEFFPVPCMRDRSAVRGGEDVLGRPEGEGVRGGRGAQPRVARHGQPWPRPDPEVQYTAEITPEQYQYIIYHFDCLLPAQHID